MAGALVDTNILQTAVAMGLNALREQIVLARIVNREYESEIQGATVGETVKVAVPSAIATRSVTPDVVPPAVTAVTPTSVPVTVDQWEEAPFAMDDKGVVQIQNGIIPMQLSEASKSLANSIDDYIWGLLHGSAGIYGYAGTAGTTPFSTDLSEYLTARQIANDQLMPMDPENRFMILDTLAEANALGLRSVQDFKGGDALIRGEIGTLLGARWVMSQNVPTHTVATTPSGWLVNQADHAVGDNTVTIDTGSTDPAAGDIFTVAGDTQTYMVESYSSNVITYRPDAKTAFADDAAITFKAEHKVNTLIHRDCVAFAMAPLSESAQTEARSARTAIAIDEESGLALRLEVSDQYKQTQWALDALYGGAVIRPELGVRLAG